MNRSQLLIEKMDKFAAHNYHPLPIVLARGQGAKVWDVDGKEYLDFLACYSALNFGHQHPQLLAALKGQVEKLAVCSRAFYAEELSLFSEELANFCGMESVLTMNTGTEAVETAIKVARKWGYKKKGVNEGDAKILVMKNNFHGRTVTVVSFSTDNLYRDGFGPFTPGFEVLPYGDLGAVERAINDKVVAVLAEPIQAEAGILVPPSGYLRSLRELCRQKNVLLMFDEIQTGLGRTGRDFCYQHEGAVPDVLILGKSLGGGLLPLSAVVTHREVMDVIGPGQHGSTFGGNPLACAVGRAVLRLMRTERPAERAEHLGRLINEELRRTPLPKVKEIRGKGALVGIEMAESTGGARKFCEKLATLGVLCKETHDFVIRIAPPLVISDSDLRLGLNKIIQVIQAN
jgi:ornithine--oxo-acid transaminase